MAKFNIHNWQGDFRRMNESLWYKDFRNDSFTVKAISFTYTSGRGQFYGAYLYDVPKTTNVGWRAKLGHKEAQELLRRIDIKDELPRFYDEWVDGTRFNDSPAMKAFGQPSIIQQLKAKGIFADVNDLMDVS